MPLLGVVVRGSEKGAFDPRHVRLRALQEALKLHNDQRLREMVRILMQPPARSLRFHVFQKHALQVFQSVDDVVLVARRAEVAQPIKMVGAAMLGEAECVAEPQVRVDHEAVHLRVHGAERVFSAGLRVEIIEILRAVPRVVGYLSCCSSRTITMTIEFTRH